MPDIRHILDEPGTKAAKRKFLREAQRDYERMRSTLAIIRTWCRHDAARTTHEQIVDLIDGTLEGLR